MAINRAPFNALVDDDGSNTVGSIWNKNAIKNVLLDPIDAALVQAGRAVQRITLTGAQHDLGLTVPGVDTLLVCNNASLLTLDGIAGGVDGQVVTIVAANAQVDLPHAASGSVSGNRFANHATSALTSLAAASGIAVYQYDATAAVWRLIAHEQGAWIDVPYSAANFSAGAGGWAVESADVYAFRYRLSGRALTIALYLSATSVSGSPGALALAVPGGFLTAATFQVGMVMISDAGSPYGFGFTQIAASRAFSLYKANVGAWTNGTNNTAIFATLIAEVQ